MTQAAAHGRGGSPPSGFNFTDHIGRLCADMALRVEELRHVDMSRVAVSLRQTRKRMQGGLYASLTPLRFAGGETHGIRRGRRWTVQHVKVDGREMLYVLNFYLPRFLDLCFREKLITIAHELLHISPNFDGDLRRFSGRCYAHSGRQSNFDAHADRLAQQWLAQSPPESLYGFLNLDFQRLQSLHGRVHGRRIMAPKLLPAE